jgi:hypothetical protein
MEQLTHTTRTEEMTAGRRSKGGASGSGADLVEKESGRTVDLRSYAVEGQTSEDLLTSLRSDDGLPGDIDDADFVVIGTGGGDLNLGDAALLAGACKPRECYDKALSD